MRITFMRASGSGQSPKPQSAASARGRRDSRHRRLTLESLESRCLLSSITEFSTPPASNGQSAQPSEITAAGGKIWFTEQTANAVGMIDPAKTAAGVTIYSQNLANSQPLGITTGPDGNVWFTETSGNAIGMLNPNNPTAPIVSHHLPGGTFPATPIGITSADGSLWYTDPSNNAIGKLDPQNPSSPPAELTVSPSTGLIGINALSSQIVSTPDGNLWFTEAAFDTSGKITSSAVGIYHPTTGTWSEIALPNSAGKEPLGITVGPDGNIWLTEYVNGGSSAALATINVSTHAVTEYPLSAPTGGKTPLPYRITSGPDGNVWYTDAANSLIGSINLTSKAVQTQQIPTTSVTPDPNGIVSGPDGNLWFADGAGDVGRLALAPQATHLLVYNQPPYQLPASLSPGTPFTVVAYAATSLGGLETTFSGNITISLANNPGGSTLGGTTTVAAKGGVATFTGLTLNNPGAGYTLQVSGGGLTPATTTPFTVQAPAPPPAPPPAPQIQGATVLTTQKTNKKGKPIGKPVLTGYQFTFNMAMNSSTAGNSANYVVQTYVLVNMKVGKRTKKVPKLEQIGFTLKYISSNTVRLLTGKQAFKSGGQITLIGTGISSAAGAFLGGDPVYSIYPGGRRIT